MKISKKFLKQIIKEEIESLHEIDDLIQTHIKLKPSEFLDLTTGEKYPKSALEARLESAKKDIASKGKDLKKELSKAIPSLVLDFNGKVTNHEGRMRMYYFENYESNNPREVLIIHPKSLDLSKPNLMLHNQFGEETSVQLNNPTLSIICVHNPQPTAPCVGLKSKVFGILYFTFGSFSNERPVK